MLLPSFRTSEKKVAVRRNLAVSFGAVKRNGVGKFALKDAVLALIRPELQLRRSEWVDLRRQLDPAHRVGNYRLHYDEDRLRAALDGFEGSSRYYRAVKKLGQEVNALLGDTVFLTMLRPCLKNREICSKTTK